MHYVLNTFLIFCFGVIPVTYAAERSAPVTEPADPALEERLQNIERALQNQGLLDMLQQLKALQQEISNLRGQIEVNNHEIEQLKEQQRNLYTDLDNRIQRLGQANPDTIGTTVVTEEPPLEIITPTEPVTPVAGNQAETGLTVETIERTTDKPADTTGSAVTEVPPITEATDTPAVDPIKAQAEYQQAFRLLKQAEYDQAITAFDKYLSKYPESQYSDNAQYWMGEAFYVTRRFDAAITEYMKLVSNYPESQKTPLGLLKIGYSYYELGQKDEARKALEELIKRYPESSAAREAENRISRNNSPS